MTNTSTNKKNILLIGGSQGIGREIARQLSEEHHVLVLSRNLSQLQSLQSECKGKIQIATIDLCSETLKEELESIISATFSTVDVLINNAGKLINLPILETTLSDIESVYKTNVFGLIQSCQAVIPFMKKGGHIVNIGSIGGIQGSVKFPGIGIYSSSKAAVAGFTECLAEELKEENIQVNCLALGAVQTEMLAAAFPDYQAPMGPVEMAEFIADFALRANQWMNGKIIPVSKSTP
ncbi:MAG: SDR family oxidoreductase [Crocinitomicaceae bacterium]